MKNYVDYEVVDFLLDDSFINWATGKSFENDDFWTVWPNRYPENAEVYYQALEISSNLRIVPTNELSETEISALVTQIGDKSFNSVLVNRRKIKKLRFNTSWLRVAAAALIISTIGFWAYLKSAKGPANLLTAVEKVEVEKRNQSKLIRLPDNSTVVLKPGSRLTYNTKFVGESREVYLDGEAFFEVSKDKNRPFIVHTNELITKVLGTSFSVKAYSADKEFNVTVNTGKVSVFTKSTNPPHTITSKSLDKLNGVLITSNQQVSFYRKEVKLLKKKLEKPAPLSAEVTHVSLNFKETPFSEVAGALSNAYGIKINYDEVTMASCPLTASLSNQHLYEKLDLICQALEASYRIENGQIYINGKGCRPNKPIN